MFQWKWFHYAILLYSEYRVSYLIHRLPYGSHIQQPMSLQSARVRQLPSFGNGFEKVEV